MLKLDLSYLNDFIDLAEIEAMQPMLQTSRQILENGTGAGAEYLGWLDLPLNYDRGEFARIKELAAEIRDHSDVLIVCGIGGSYLGARAVIEALADPFSALRPVSTRDNPLIIYAGHHLSGRYLNSLLSALSDYRVTLNIISKSGTTTEPAIAFRILEQWMIDRYGLDGARKRIFATTDKEKGALKQLADIRGYETFVVPDNIGGRYSVLTAVGLLPIAVAGISIDDLMAGAVQARENYSTPLLWENDCDLYAVTRNVLQKRGYTTEILVNYEPGLNYVSEWWKQLFGESEGKDGRGLFPASMNFTTDLHSLGQYVQDGRRILLETVLQIETLREDILINESEENLDGLNYLAGKSLGEVNHKALYGTLMAHVAGGVPVQLLKMSELSAYSLGELMYFFQRACGISGYLNSVNPFDQPGVENYKNNMYALLGKPGYETARAELEKILFPKEDEVR
ncbi:MAG TPA: glucose-6-phosphate isomerase [Clostridiaceae bacterium]|nr:glucose-6-phosphate isomerase [Clostridiaceae bacterium]